jgi:hypothetical protein
MPEEAVERASGPLQNLEVSFRPLVAKLSDDVEPAVAMFVYPRRAE